MYVETEFQWPLSNGVMITVNANGNYFRNCQTIFPLAMGFDIAPGLDALMTSSLSAIKADMALIEEHAVLALCEKGRAELKESS